MKKLLVALSVIGALALAAQAGEGKKEKKLTDEQKAVYKELLAKYDANKDGKLDKEERAKMSAEDKEKAEKAGLGRKKQEKKN
jgi:Ca2+-binding EF-hand superfamily protein